MATQLEKTSNYAKFINQNLDETQMDPLAEELTRSPGPNGWGSPKKIIDQHF